jgi:hypothetical protein
MEARASGRCGLPHFSGVEGRRLATLPPGGVPERPNGAVLKTVDGGSRPWVRIPPPPLADSVVPHVRDGLENRVEPSGRREFKSLPPVNQKRMNMRFLAICA